MQDDTHVCVSGPHKKEKKTLLIRNRPSNDPIIEMGVAHAFKRCIFEHPSSVVLNKYIYVHAKPRLEVQLCNFIVREISIVSWH